MNGAIRHPETAVAGTPPPDVVHDVHDRFLLEVVEMLGLCPFARRSRELGRVHRPLVYDPRASPTDVATRLHGLVAAHPDAEIVLFTFIDSGPRGAGPPRFGRARDLDDFVKEVRPIYDALGGPTFFMVGFHPTSGEPDPGDARPRATADSLVPALRRTPDPVIQCVRAEVLERVRWQAQQAAHAKMMADAEKLDPRLRKILEHSVQPDSSLSADIARRNFEAVGQGEARLQLEARLTALLHDRDEAYAPYWGSDDEPVRLRSADYRRMRWANGLGWTTELAVHPAHGELEWRVSIAEVDTDCEFSQLPGVDRTLLVLEGDGLALAVDDAPEVLLRPGGEALAFSGDRVTRCRLLGGPTRDFNVMTRRSRYEHVLTTHHLANATLALAWPAGDGWLVYVTRGHARIGELDAGPHDSVLAKPRPRLASTITITGEADIILVRLTPADSPL